MTIHNDYHECKFTKFAQEKLNNPNWFPWKFERVVGGVLLTGAECPLKRDGQPNVRKHDKATKCTVVFPVSDDVKS